MNKAVVRGIPFSSPRFRMKSLGAGQAIPMMSFLTNGGFRLVREFTHDDSTPQTETALTFTSRSRDDQD